MTPEALARLLPDWAKTCGACRRRPAVCYPVVVVPILRWPVPLYLEGNFTLCNACAYSFTLDKFTDYKGAWYDLAGDTLRAFRVPAKNPFPHDPSFKWEEFILNPKYDPAPKEQCVLKFWPIERLAAKGMHQRIDAHLGVKR